MHEILLSDAWHFT